MLENVKYWLQDKPVRNFGDYLSDYFLKHLFAFAVPFGGSVRIVGSCIDDMFMPNGEQVVFWGCGLREPGGLGESNRQSAEILSVRGPLSRSDLRLGAATPMGDPGLLLPFLHARDPARPRGGASLLVPHFHDTRSDAELLALSGCAAVLRPNIAGSLSAIDDFLSVLTEAEFVLGASMHAVIAAAGYGVPFGFWDSGNIDLPFKWADFAASIGIAGRFHATLASARSDYDREVASALRIPPLWPMLAASPFPIRPNVWVRVVEADIARHGTTVLDAASTATADKRAGEISEVFGQLQGSLEAERDEAVRLQTKFAEAEAAKIQLEAGLADSLARLKGAEAMVALEFQRRLSIQHTVQHAQTARADAARRVTKAEEDAARAQAAERALRDEQGFEQASFDETIDQLREELRRAIESRDMVRERLEHQATELALLQRNSLRPALNDSPELVHLRALHTSLLASTSWRALAPMRRLSARTPGLSRWARRILRLCWWTARGQVVARLRQRLRAKTNVALLQRHKLFDPIWYASRYLLPPTTDPATHYVWEGASAGFDPHPLFDSSWYRLRNPQIAGQEIPLIHYIETGAENGLDPHPLFDTQYFLSQTGGDPSPGVTPLEHYLDQAVDSDRMPNRLFDGRRYRFEYMDDAVINPLIHFIQDGEQRGLDPHPCFHTEWYASQHPDRGDLGPLAHFLRQGSSEETRPWPAVVGRLPPGPLAFPAVDAPAVSIVVPAYGAYAQTYRCLLAIMTNTPAGIAFEVILADDRPAAPIGPLFEDVPNLRVHVNAENLGFLRNCNHAATIARSECIVFLNNDTLVAPDWLRPLLTQLADPTVGMVGCKLLNVDGSIQEAGGSILSNGWGWCYGAGDDPGRGAYNFVRDVDVVTGACFAIRRDDFSAVGGFDNRYAPAFYEEFDLAITFRDRGLRTVYQPASQVVHLGSASYGAETRDRQSLRNHAQFVKKWLPLLPAQPSPGAPPFVIREHSAPRGVILVIDDKVPEYDKHAGAVTLFQYLCLMHEIGLKVIYYPIDGQPVQPYTSALQQRGIEVLHLPDTLEGWLLRNGVHLDFVWIARPDVASPALDLLRRTTGASILYYTHDLHYLRETRRFELDGDPWAKQESERLKPIELAVFAGVDHVMTPSDEEARIIRQEVPHAHVTVVPPYLFPAEGLANAADLDFQGRDALIFVGGFDHTPNVDAAIWLATDIMPLVWREHPEIRLLLVGNAPPPAVQNLAADRIEVTGFVEDLAPYYARSRVAVSPLRYGAGVKGKIVGSLRAAVPVVTTSVGNEGIRLRDGIEAMIADDAEGIARGILALCNDEALCRRLAAAGMEVLNRQFSKERARSTLLHLLGDDTCPVCGTRPRSAGPAGQNWREAFSCNACNALNRTAALAEIMLQPYRPQRLVSLRAAHKAIATLRVHEFGFVGPVQAILRGSPNFTMSDFFPDVPLGQKMPGGIQCEDLQALTFEDESIDLAISQDVMEHVPDMERAFREIFRVLRPSGRHIFTIPYSTTRPITIRRAEIVDGTVRHILAPEYHGDPIRKEGALAFWDYGADLPALLRTIGFDVKLHTVRWSEKAVMVFETVKPAV